MQRLPLSLLLASTLLILASCAETPPLTMGSSFDGTRTARLTRGKTTKLETRSILGEANGYGRARHDADHEPYDIWYYEFMIMKGAQTYLDILLVFFDAEVYQGHLWFVSNELFQIGLSTKK